MSKLEQIVDGLIFKDKVFHCFNGGFGRGSHVLIRRGGALRYVVALVEWCPEKLEYIREERDFSLAYDAVHFFLQHVPDKRKIRSY